MKRHALIMSAALLSTALLLGCEDQGSGPLAPDGLSPRFAKPSCPGPHPSCKDDAGDGEVTVFVDFDDAFDGAVGGVKVFADNKKKFQLNNNVDTEVNIDLNFALTAALADNCTIDPMSTPTSVVNALKAQLTRTAPSARFEVQVATTKLGEASDGHGVGVTYTETRLGLGLISMGLPPHRSPTANRLDDGTTSTSVYEFHGDVRVWLREGKTKDHVKLVCLDAGDVVTVTLTKETA